MDLTGAATTLGLDAARALDPSSYAIGGASPRVAVRPVSAEELAEAVGAAAREGLAVVPWGGGVALRVEAAPERYDAAVDVTALNRVIEYEPEDLTLTAECGVTLASLRATLAARGQELPLEAANAEAATLGGILAANASGPRRLRFGAPRDRVLGASFVLGDGTRARTGGKVVKNVAGYGIHRLLCGSRGGLGVITRASLKLAPAPASRVALIYGAAADEVANPARGAGLPRLEPAAVTVLGADAARAVGVSVGQTFASIVVLEDDAPWVAEQERRVVEALGPAADRRQGEAAARLIQGLADLEESFASRISFTTSWNSPAALGVLREGPLARSAVFHALAGRLHVFPEPATTSDTLVALVRSGFVPIATRRAGSVEGASPSWAAVGDLRRRIREALDPGRTWSYGSNWQRGD